MLAEDQFKRNISRWSETHPGAAPLLEQPCARVMFHTNKNESLNLQITRDGKAEFIHSSDPVAEASDWFAQQDLRHIKVLFVFGVGLGYAYEAALQWLRSNPDHYLVFLENDLEVIHCLLQTPRGTTMLYDDQVWLSYLGESSKPALHLAAILFSPRSHTFSTLHYYQMTQSSTAQSIQEQLDVLMNGRKQTLAEYISSKTFYKNFFSNFALMPQAYLGNQLFGQFKDVPAIICGAGPSLAHSLPLLQTLKNRALIFAGGTAMNAVNTTGLLPHFGVGVDPNPAQFTRLIMNDAFETPYFYRNRMLNAALDLVQGDHLYISGGAVKLVEWFENKLGIREEEIEGGHNVINFSLAIAYAMGCNPIIFVGVDLAYTDGLSYCPGLLNHPLHEKRRYFQTKSIKDEVIIRCDVHGNPISTQIKWVTESLWFTTFAAHHPEVILINASNGGIGFEGIPHLPLDQVANSWLTREFDFNTIIHDKIQHATMPEQVTHEHITNLLQEFLQSLQRCYDACLIAGNEFYNIVKGLAGDREAAEQPETDAQSRLLAEPAYQHMLEFYKTIYIELHSLVFRRLTNPKYKLTESEVALQKALIYRDCYDAIAKIAKDNIDLLTNLLEQSSTSSTKSKPINNETHTTIQKQILPHNTVKIRKFYKDGSLYSVEQLVNEKPDGPQEYFYPDQTKKSLLNYAQGKLDGTIRMYHTNGNLKRELSFTHGQRHGAERLWSETGQLLIEAEFDHNQPCNVARQWNASGQLIKEVVYSSDTDFTIREWDADGALIVQEEGARADYFERAFGLLGQLIAQLEQALQQTHTLEPIIEKTNPQSLVNLHRIKTELEINLVKVREIHLHLRQEVEIVESIWKSPTNQRRLERQLDELAAKVNHELKQLQDIFSESIQALIREKNEKPPFR